MRATPDGFFESVKMNSVLILSDLYISNACNPKRSYPILDINVTSAPSRAAAMA